MKNAHTDAISHGIRQLMLVRKMAIEMEDMTEEEVDAFINAEGEKWMQKTKDINAIECMFELMKLQHDLNEQVNESK